MMSSSVSVSMLLKKQLETHPIVEDVYDGKNVRDNVVRVLCKITMYNGC